MHRSNEVAYAERCVSLFNRPELKLDEWREMDRNSHRSACRSNPAILTSL